MNMILSHLCYHLLSLLLLDAVAVKLIPGSRSVVKKDGATHTISKYYVVPNDLDVTNVAASSSATQLGSRNRYYVKSKNSELGVHENKFVEKGLPGGYVVSVDDKKTKLGDSGVAEFETGNVYQPDGSETGEWVSVSTQMKSGSGSANHVLETDDRVASNNLELESNVLGSHLDRRENVDEDNVNIWVKLPSRVTKAKKTVNVRENLLVNPLYQLESEKRDAQNGYNVVTPIITPQVKPITRENGIYDDAKLKLNILDNVESSDQPFAIEQKMTNLPYSIEDKALNIQPLQTTITTEDKTTNLPFPVDDKNNLLFTVEDRKNPNLPFTIEDRQDPDSTFTVEDKQVPNRPFKIKDRHIPNLPFTIEDRTVPVPNLPFTIEDRKVPILPFTIEDRNIPNIPYTIEDRKLPDIPFTIEDRNIPNIPFTIEDRNIFNIPYTIEDRSLPDIPFTIEDRQVPNIPYTIEDRKVPSLPFTIEDRKVPSLPFTIEDRNIFNIPYTIEDRKLPDIPFTIGDRTAPNTPYTIEDREIPDIPFTIEDRQVPNIPYTIEDRNMPNIPYTIEDRNLPDIPFTIEDRNIPNMPFTIEDRNVPNLPISIKNKKGTMSLIYPSEGLPGRAHSIILKNKVVKPALYTYVIHPTKIVYKSPDINSFIKILTGKYNNKFDGHNIYSKKADSRVVLINKPSLKHYKSELSFSGEPSVVLNNDPSYYGSQINIAKNIELPSINKGSGNPVILISNTPPSQLESTIELQKEKDHIPKILFPDTSLYKSVVQVGVENDSGGLATHEVSDSDILLPNVPSTSYLNIRNDAISKPIVEIERDINPVLPTTSASSYHESEVKVNLEPAADNNPTILLPNTPAGYVKLNRGYTLPTSSVVAQTNVNAEYNNVLIPDDSLRPYKVRLINKPNVLSYSENIKPGYGILNYLRANLAPSFQLFNTENLLKLHDSLTRRMLNPRNIYEHRALTNLMNINIILLKLAEYLGLNQGNLRLYENVLYNIYIRRHPLYIYAQNLLRQKWLHQIMLLLYKSNFNLNVLNIPTIYSFLGAWRFPNYVLNFLETQQESVDSSIIFDDTFGTQNIVQGNIDNSNIIFEGNSEAPEILDKDESENIVDGYNTQKEGIILSITGLDAGLDARTVTNILKKYLHYKTYIENQENMINRGNKIEMFKQISVFLREKGYDNRTVYDLLRKLHREVYSVESRPCSHSQYNDIVKNVYDVIVPVLRRAGN